MDAEFLTREDCQLLLIIINNARITGADAMRVVQLQARLGELIKAKQHDSPNEPDNPGGTA